jgi:hypothetical protein
LGEIAMPILEIACSRCERRGRLSVARLIARYGVEGKLPDLQEVLAGDCPRVGATSIYERCGVHYPTLPNFSAPVQINSGRPGKVVW